MKLITLGPEGTFSHLAALKYSPLSEIDFVSGIDEGFDLLKNKNHDALLAPVENLLYGTIRETLDGLYESGFKIHGAITLPIHHTLLTRGGRIRKIFSHPQALNQCRLFLKKNYPKTELIACNSTSQACEKASLEKESAAIAHESCLQWYPKLQIKAQKIEDNSKNRTKFLIISDDYSLLNEKITAIIIEPNSDEKGTLLQILKILKGVNLTKIESRPNRNNLGNYLFFIDFEGDFRQPAIAALLRKLSKAKAVKKLRVLGSFTP